MQYALFMTLKRTRWQHKLPTIWNKYCV